MKILVTYSSKTGNTKKLAEGIFKGLKDYDTEIMSMEDVKELVAYDYVLVGFWVDKGAPNDEAKEFMEKIENKKVGIFGTLAFWPDSRHGFESLMAGEELVKEKNHVIGRFICQGKVNEEILKKFENLPKDNPHYPTPEKRKRHKISANHPSEADIACAVEMFAERIGADV